VPVADNVTISLTDKQFDWHGTNYQLGRGRTFCSDKTMLWVFRIENASAAGFTPNVDPDNMTMVDSTGKSYKLTEGCYAPFMGPFEGYTTQAGQQDFAGVSFATDSVPATATYFDLTITITGTQLTFRYHL
jgi:hypothetical protein